MIDSCIFIIFFDYNPVPCYSMLVGKPKWYIFWFKLWDRFWVGLCIPLTGFCVCVKIQIT